jgi:hypothetical protein
LKSSVLSDFLRHRSQKPNWSDIKFSDKRRVVPRYKGKNDQRYPVTLPDNEIEWLRPYDRESGSLLAISRAANIRGKLSKDRTNRLIAEAAARAGVIIPDNGGRNSLDTCCRPLFGCANRPTPEETQKSGHWRAHCRFGHRKRQTSREGTCAMITTTDRDDEETVFQSSHREWVEDQELRQQELGRLAVKMFPQS